MDVLARLLEATVVTLREGIEAALVIALLLACLRRTGRADLTRVVLWALAAAVAASAAAAVLVRRVGLDPENEVWEGTVMLVAAACVGSLIVWMRRAGKRLGSAIDARVTGLVAADGRRAAIGLFAFTFVMVFREGVETALFLGALSGAIGANPLYNALGGALGLVLATLFGVLLAQGSARIDLGRFFRATELVLLLLVAKLLANGLHEFFEVGLLPSSELALQVVGLFTRGTTSVLVLVSLIAVPAALLVVEAWRARVAAAPRDETPAGRRRRYAELRASRRWMATGGFAGLALGLLVALSGIATARGFDPVPVKLAVSAPVVTIPIAELGEQPLKKYEVAIDGVPVRFFVTRTEGDRVAVALDACAICPLSGYHVLGEHLVCGNCGAPIAAGTIGVAGGCNPIPLPADITADAVRIRVEDLRGARSRFAHRG